MSAQVDSSHTRTLEEFARERSVVLVFLPNTNELQRFVLSGAFDVIAREHELHYVLPEADAEKMRAAAPTITAENSSTLAVPPERFKKWTEVFQAGCVHHARLSPSFAIRAGLEVDPEWQQAWSMPHGERDAFDREFDLEVARILDGMQPLAELVDLFDSHSPVYCVVPTSLLDLFCNEVTWAAEVEGVSCLLLQSGWDNLSSKGLLHTRTPFLGCWGRQSRQHAEVIQRLPRGNVGELGAPHYEFLKPAPADDVRRLRADLGVGEDERLVLFGGAFRQFDETSTLLALERSIARGRFGPVKIVYRPHPWRAARQHEDSFFAHQWSHVVFDPDMRDRYVREQSEAGFIKRNVPMFDMAYVSLLLSAADVVISPMSTLLLEALILEKPTMAIAFGDGKHRHDPSVTARMTHFAGLQESGALVWCGSPALMKKAVAKLLRSKVSNDLAKAGRRLVHQLVATEPGTYAERLAAFCRSHVVRQGRKLRGRRTGVRRGTISHAYGAHLIASEYSGLADDAPVVPGYWMHGWIPAYHNVHPAVIALHKKEGQHEGYDFEAQIREEKAHTAQWVGREDQAEFLKSHGYARVEAIGLPIVYVPVPEVQRLPGSLLVMPPHSHKTHGPDDPLAERYADAIASLSSRFEHVWVGLNEDDMSRGQWVESFRKRGVKVFTTTDQADPRALIRLRSVLSSFEYVTTNGFGSHIAFAAYCGAKVSVFGPFAEFPLDRMSATHAVKMFPHLLEQAYDLCTEAALRKHYGFLFVDPDKAGLQQEWGAREVGEPSRVSPVELRHLFDWGVPLTSPSGNSEPTARRQPRPAAFSSGSSSSSATGSPAAARAEPERRRVLFGMAHVGFFRNFESVVAGLCEAGLDVHVHFSKAHNTISLDDYRLPAVTEGGRLTFSTSDPTKVEYTAVERLRIIRDLVHYSRPWYRPTLALRERFSHLQKRRVLSVARQRRMARLLRWTPEFVKDAVDAVLSRRDERMPPDPAVTDLVDQLKPDCIVVTPLVNFASREVDLVKAGRRRGIPTLLAVASWDNLTNKGRLKVQPDRVAVWNEAMVHEAVAFHGVPRDRIRITGAPVFDPWFGRAPERDRKSFLESLGLKPSRRLLVFTCSSGSIAGTSEYRVIRRWLAAVRSAPDDSLQQANVLIRPHPMNRANWREVTSLDERGHARLSDAVVWPLQPKHPTDPVSRADFFDTLYHADAIVGLNTSAMLEAVILGRPVLTFVGHEGAASQTQNLHFRHLTGSGCVHQARTLHKHITQLARVLDRPRRASPAFQRFITEFVRPLGHGSSASAALVNTILAEMKVTPVGAEPHDAREPALAGLER